MQYLCFFVSLFACILGKICGMGGGVIIKPTLDAFGILSVPTINFLSGCTVISMSAWAVGKSFLTHELGIDLRVSSPIAIGAAIGGFLGKALFSSIAKMFPTPNMAGGIQAILLFCSTLVALTLTIIKNRIPSLHIKNPIVCLGIGLFLGTLGSFLGIGGGPFNMLALFLLFSMTTKVAALNSLFIILVSQVVGLLQTILSNNLPSFDILTLVLMFVGSIVGCEIGGRINKLFSEKQITCLFILSMGLILCICIYNAYQLGF